MLTIDDAVSAVSKWLEYVENPSPADADHSSLLRRLLEGKEPFPNPPPRRFSYPCYDLAEGKEVQIIEASEWINTNGEARVVIDQCGDWRKMDDRQELAGELLHVPTGDIYILKIKKPKIIGINYYSGITLQKKSL